MFEQENLSGGHPSQFVNFQAFEFQLSSNKSSNFHKISLLLLFQRMNLWPEFKEVKAATISIYPTVSEDFAGGGGGLAVPQWCRPSGGLASARSLTTAMVFKERFSIPVLPEINPPSPCL